MVHDGEDERSWISVRRLRRRLWEPIPFGPYSVLRRFQVKPGRKVWAIIAMLERQERDAREELYKSQGGLPIEKCLQCSWTNQACGKIFAINQALSKIKKMFLEDTQ